MLFDMTTLAVGSGSWIAPRCYPSMTGKIRLSDRVGCQVHMRLARPKLEGSGHAQVDAKGSSHVWIKTLFSFHGQCFHELSEPIHCRTHLVSR
jgi:hypothetical protein